MSHAPGTYLGGVRHLADLRERCRIDACTGCWHLLTARGQPLPRARRHVVWVYGRGALSVLRVAYEFAFGALPADRVAYRVCDAHDCINPAHLRRGTRTQMLRFQATRGTFSTPAKAAASRAMWERRKAAPAQQEAAP